MTEKITLFGIPIHICNKIPDKNKLYSINQKFCPYCGEYLVCSAQNAQEKSKENGIK